MIIEQPFSREVINGIASVLADCADDSEIGNILDRNGIRDGREYSSRIGRLQTCLLQEEGQAGRPAVLRLVALFFAPQRFMSERERRNGLSYPYTDGDRYMRLIARMNQVLRPVGYSLQDDGEVHTFPRANQSDKTTEAVQSEEQPSLALETLCPPFDQDIIQSIAKTLATAATAEDITKITDEMGIPYTYEGAKWRSLKVTMQREQHRDGNGHLVLRLVEAVLTPKRFLETPKQFAIRRDEVNAALAFEGWCLRDDGLCVQIPRVATLREVTDVAEGKEQPDLEHDNPTIGNIGDGSSAGNRKVFIIHGTDRGNYVDEVKKLVQLLELEPVVLEEQPNEGMTVPDKLRAHTKGSAFHIAVLTMDDEMANGDVQPRQNAVAEAVRAHQAWPGSFAMLVEEGTKVPSDLAGVAYIPLTGQWSIGLLAEIKAASIVRIVHGR